MKRAPFVLVALAMTVGSVCPLADPAAAQEEGAPGSSGSEAATPQPAQETAPQPAQEAAPQPAQEVSSPAAEETPRAEPVPEGSEPDLVASPAPTAASEKPAEPTTETPSSATPENAQYDGSEPEALGSATPSPTPVDEQYGIEQTPTTPEDDQYGGASTDGSPVDEQYGTEPSDPPTPTDDQYVIVLGQPDAPSPTDGAFVPSSPEDFSAYNCSDIEVSDGQGGWFDGTLCGRPEVDPDGCRTTYVFDEQDNLYRTDRRCGPVYSDESPAHDVGFEAAEDSATAANAVRQSHSPQQNGSSTASRNSQELGSAAPSGDRAVAGVAYGPESGGDAAPSPVRGGAGGGAPDRASGEVPPAASPKALEGTDNPSGVRVPEPPRSAGPDAPLASEPLPASAAPVGGQDDIRVLTRSSNTRPSTFGNQGEAVLTPLAAGPAEESRAGTPSAEAAKGGAEPRKGSPEVNNPEGSPEVANPESSPETAKGVTDRVGTPRASGGDDGTRTAPSSGTEGGADLRGNDARPPSENFVGDATRGSIVGAASLDAAGLLGLPSEDKGFAVPRAAFAPGLAIGGEAGGDGEAGRLVAGQKDDDYSLMEGPLAALLAAGGLVGALVLGFSDRARALVGGRLVGNARRRDRY